MFDSYRSGSMVFDEKSGRNGGTDSYERSM